MSSPLHPVGQETESTDNNRMFLTIAIIAGLYMVWATWFAPPIPPPEADGEQKQAQAGETATPSVPGAPTPQASSATTTPPTGTPTDLPEVKVPIAIDVAGDDPDSALKGGFKAIVSSHGAQLSAFELTGYGDPLAAAKGEEANLDVVHGAHDGASLFAMRSRGGDYSLRTASPFTIVEKSASHVVLKHESGGVELERRYEFKEGSFAFGHVVKVTNRSANTRSVELDTVMIGASRQASEASFFAPGVETFEGSCQMSDEGREAVNLQDATDDAPSFTGPTIAASIGWQYFIAAIAPENPKDAAGCSVQAVATAAGGEPDALSVVYSLPRLVLQAGESKSFSSTLYVGPKQLGALADAGHALSDNVDFGMFGVLSRPILALLVWIYELIGNFGLAIIFLTLTIKLITFPLTQKSYVSMAQMRTIAPEIKELQKKYGHDRAVLGQKQMELYQTKGINPMAGCLPVLIQMPIWFALYRTLWMSVELYQQPFFGWINDLSQPDSLSLIGGLAFLPFIVGALMLGQTLMQPPPQEQPQMKYVMWSMPIVFTFFMFGMPSGLSLYMITNSVLTIIQQAYIKKKYG